GVSSYYNSSLSTKKNTPIMATIDGKAEFTSSLSGIPTIQLILNLNKHDIGIPSFHRCIDIDTWTSSPGVIEFVPPDGKFKLLDYKINLLENDASVNIWNYMGLVDLELVGGQ
ncbi:hypothetical protein WICPIJ_001281, partial [Wickerhamomyces pijperi]